MTSDEIIVALDIGTSKICAFIAEFDEEGDLTVAGVGMAASKGLRRGVVVNIEAAMKAVEEAIDMAEQQAGRTVESVLAGIAGGNIEGINSRGVVAVTGKGREINRVDVERVIDAAKAIVMPMDREVLHVIPQEYIVDDQAGIKNPVDMIGVRLESEVHIITSTISASKNIIKCINRSGYKVDEIVLESIGASYSVLSRDEKELGVLFLDIGNGTTDLLVHFGGAPYYTSVLPVGAQEVTNDLSIMLNIPFDEAERIKLQSGCCWEPLIDRNESVIIPGIGGRPPVSVPEMRICRILQPRMAELFLLVKKQLGEKGYLSRLGGGLVITGGGALLPGVAELAQEIFKMPARIGYPKNIKGLEERYRSPEYSTVTGLLQYKAQQIEEEGPVVDIISSGVIVDFFRRIGTWFKEFI
ncbi:MAG: cell division protein FtsA [Spirochaetaceae bacterium]|nr:cell division protein FtsA [Spirochaetaceae bacterium]